MNAGYYVGKWITKLINANGDGGAIKIVSSYIGTYAAKEVVKLVIAKAASWKIGAALGAKLGTLAGPVGTFIAGLCGAL